MKTKRMLPIGEYRAAMANSSVNAEKRTATMVWSTGSKGLRSNWGESYYEELSMEAQHVDMSRLQSGAPLLSGHDQSLDGVIGVVERAWLENGKGLAQVRFATDVKSDAIFQKVRDGIINSISVGYSVAKYEDVSGPKDTTPTYRATAWTPQEISVVAVGFDANARVRNQTSQTEVEIIHRPHDEGTMKMQNNDQVIAERTRVLEIRKLAKLNNLPETFADSHIENGATVEAARVNAEMLVQMNQSTKINGTQRVEIGSDNDTKKRELFVEATTERICPSFKPSQDARMFKNMSLIRSIEHLNGRRLGESDAQLAKRAMSTSDFPLLLANVAEKALQARYAVAPRSFEAWVTRDTLKNYKQSSQLRAGDYPSLIERHENGEYQHGSFGEQHELVALRQFGNIVSFSEKAIVNDDLQALQQVSQEGALAAARLENTLVYSALTSNPTMGDSIAMFHASHSNLGTAGAIADASVGEAYQLMRKQTSVDGLDALNLAPSFLICGPDKEQEARKFLAAINANQTSNVNIYSGLLQLVVDAKIIGNQYYFACDPKLVPTVVLFGLEGQEGPTITSKIDFNTDAILMKVGHNVVAAPMDWRGLFKNAGN